MTNLMVNIRVWLGVSLLILLQSCSQLPPKSNNQQQNTANTAHIEQLNLIHEFKLHGRIGIQNNGQGLSGQIDWQHNKSNDHIAIFSPFGGQVASIDKNLASATLIDDKGETYTADNIQALMQNNLGWYIPLELLVDWALGRPSTHDDRSQAIMTWNHAGHIQKITQNGWEVAYQHYLLHEGYTLPSKLTLRKDQLYLKLIIESWDLH